MSEIAIASEGAFGIGPQTFDKSEDTCKGQSVGSSPGYQWYPLTRVGFGAQQIMNNLPQAIARSILPRGQYKAGVYSAGMAELVPSLEDDFGWLLAAVVGQFGYSVLDGSSDTGAKMGTTKGSYPDVTDEAGVYVHQWVPEAQRSRLPWFTARKLLPQRQASLTLGETVADCRATGMVVNVPGSGVVSAQIGITDTGSPTFDDDPGWAPAYEQEYFAVVSDSASFIAFEIGSGTFVAAPCVGATITLDNGIVPPTDPRIWVIGNTSPYDLPAFGPRVVSIRAAVLIDTTSNAGYEIYSYIMANAALASMSAWSSTPYKADVQLRAVSPFMVTGSVPYILEFLTIAGNCTYTLAGAIPLASGEGVTLVLDITPQEVTAASVSDTSTSGSTSTVVKTAAGWSVDEYAGYLIKITSGNAQGDVRIVKSNTADTLTIDSDYPFSAAIVTDTFELYKFPWMFRLQNGTAAYSWPTQA